MNDPVPGFEQTQHAPFPRHDDGEDRARAQIHFEIRHAAQPPPSQILMTSLHFRSENVVLSSISASFLPLLYAAGCRVRT